MLYVTTGSSKATYTAQYVMENATAPDGRLFLPMRLPRYEGKALKELLSLPFWDCTAQILNQFFPLHLGGRDLEALGLTEPELLRLPYKIDLAQLWNNTRGSYRVYREAILEHMGCKTKSPESWPVLAADIAVLFALYGQLRRRGLLAPGEAMCPVLAAGNLSLGVALVYAGEMGLPVGQTVLVCNENGLLWELLHRGEAKLDGEKLSTQLPLLDIAIPGNLERLLLARLGQEGLEHYLSALEKKRTFSLRPEEMNTLRDGFCVSVVGSGRGGALIPRLYKNARVLLSPYTALVYSGLMDYRSMEAEGRTALLLGEESPMQWGEAVLKALHLPVDSVTTQIARLEQEAARGRMED